MSNNFNTPSRTGILFLNPLRIIIEFSCVSVMWLIVGACAVSAPVPAGLPADLLPMYGEMERTLNSELQAADEKLIENKTEMYGSRRKASAAFVNQGFDLYQEHDLDGAMRRFNQAWILDPENLEVYWGFGAVLHNRGEHCRSMEMMEKALSFNQHITGLYPDAGRVIVLCTVSNAEMDSDQKTRNFDKAEQLFIQAAIKDRNKGYVHALWATAYYWRDRYDEAWDRVQRSRKYGGQIPDRFLSLLRQKMPEPLMKKPGAVAF